MKIKICKFCKKEYTSPKKGKYYCSNKCRYNDPDYNYKMKLIFKNRWKNKVHPKGMLGKKHSKKNLDLYKNRIPWNKGLTKFIDNRVKKYGISVGKTKREMIKLYPEKNPNFYMKNVSKPQLILFKLVKNKFSEACLNYPLQTKITTRYLDVAVPSIKLCFEFEGTYWHQDEKKDLDREFEIREKGWKIIRISNKELLNDYIINILFDLIELKLHVPKEVMSASNPDKVPV